MSEIIHRNKLYYAFYRLEMGDTLYEVLERLREVPKVEVPPGMAKEVHWGVMRVEVIRTSRNCGCSQHLDSQANS